MSKSESFLHTVVLDLEFYVGPPRKPAVVEHIMISGEDFAAIPRLDADLSAGPGADASNAQIDGVLAFRRDALASMGVSVGHACFVRVKGESMAPQLQDGDLALIDRSRTIVRNGLVYALTDIDGDTRVKRIDRPDDQTLVLRSDNPDVPSELRRGVEMNRVIIHGQLVWSAHRW